MPTLTLEAIGARQVRAPDGLVPMLALRCAVTVCGRPWIACGEAIRTAVGCPFCGAPRGAQEALRVL